MKYGIHTSPELIKLFSEKPYQGADPNEARILVIGNDANYSPEISEHSFFERILQYHADGKCFWRRKKVHHPFLLDEYPFDRRKGGVRYHQNFSKMKFDSEYAEYFSFVELLDVPTIGNTGSNRELFYRLLDENHLRQLEEWIFRGQKKFVLVNQTLAREITRISKRFGVLKELADALRGVSVERVALETPALVLYNGYSFSHSVTNAYLDTLGKLIREFIGPVRAES